MENLNRNHYITLLGTTFNWDLLPSPPVAASTKKGLMKYQYGEELILTRDI